MDRSIIPSSVGWVFNGLITVAPLRKCPCQLCTVEQKFGPLNRAWEVDEELQGRLGNDLRLGIDR